MRSLKKESGTQAGTQGAAFPGPLQQGPGSPSGTPQDALLPFPQNHSPTRGHAEALPVCRGKEKVTFY